MRLQDWERQAIIDAYLADEKIDAIAAEFNVSRQYPGQLAKRREQPARHLGRPTNKSKQSTDSVLVV